MRFRKKRGRLAVRPAVLAAAALLALPGKVRAEPDTSDLPHIVILLADDLGYGDVRAYNPEALTPTPNLDRLAREGIRFTDAHSPSSVCTPTRYGLLTGRYAWRTRLKRGVLLGFSLPLIEPDRPTIADLLRRAGYKTALVGKWHLGFEWALKEGRKLADPIGHRDGTAFDFTKPARGGPLDHGFDYFFGTSACPTTDYLYAFIEGRETVGIPSVHLPGRRAPPGKAHTLDIAYRPGIATPGWRHEDVDPTFVRKAEAWLERAVREDPNRPLFLYLALSAPHAPWLPPDFIAGTSPEGPRGDMVATADWAAGRILDALARLGLERRTLVIFTSDNGPRIGLRGHRSAGPWRGYKSHVWEGGHRVPFIARWPGRIPAGASSAEPIVLTDLFRTLSNLAGIKPPADAGEDSYDILPVLLGRRPPQPIREAVVSHSVRGAFAIRKGPWKCILGTRGSGGWVPPADRSPCDDWSIGQLYNLREDPAEERDLFDARPEVVKRLRALLERYRREGRSIPRPKEEKTPERKETRA